MSYLKYVNIKQGTKSTQRYSNGNTLPLVQLPFGMNAFTLQTNSNRKSWFYHPEDRSIEGIRLTHQPSPWIGDYAPVIMLPQREQLTVEPNLRWSGFKPEQTILKPNYMEVDFLRYRTNCKLTPTERGGIIKLTYKGDERFSFSLFTESGMSGFTIDEANNTISGYTKHCRHECSKDFTMYFVYKFDCSINAEDSFVFSKDKEIRQGSKIEGNGSGINASLLSSDVKIRFATSFISLQQANINLERELSNKDFEQVKTEAQDIWENYLSRIEIESDNEEQYRLFYSCMYRVFLFPNKFYEIDKDGNTIHFCADIGKVNHGVKYVNSGFWDTFRTVYPLYSLIAPDEFAEILEGYINTYKDCGWLPKWPSPCEVGAMPGTLIDAVIAEAAVKGIGRKALIENAFEGVIKHTNQTSHDTRYGRRGIEHYKEYGYLPNDLYKESVNNTLDYVYGDFCISQIAKSLNYHDVAKQYEEQSKNYRNLFDKNTGFMRGKDTNKKMKDTFDDCEWGGDYCEGGPWQNSFAVYHDMEGLAELHGGKEKLIEKIDILFGTEPLYKCGSYKKEIHEMTEMAAMNFGQCAISNQLSFHIPYIYAAVGEKSKTEYWIKNILENGFSSKDDGFPGDEDNGSMSGWVIFSMLGFYPFCPGKPEYIKIKPQINSAVIHCKINDYIINQKTDKNIFLSHDSIVNSHNAIGE